MYFEKIEFWKQSFFQFNEPIKSKLAIIVDVDTSQTLYFPSVEKFSLFWKQSIN